MFYWLMCCDVVLDYFFVCGFYWLYCVVGCCLGVFGCYEWFDGVFEFDWVFDFVWVCGERDEEVFG